VDTGLHGSHLLPIGNDRRNVSTPAPRCETGIYPFVVSLLNAPRTATPSSVMQALKSLAPEPRAMTRFDSTSHASDVGGDEVRAAAVQANPLRHLEPNSSPKSFSVNPSRPRFHGQEKRDPY
jgi:hypothetical protein